MARSSSGKVVSARDAVAAIAPGSCLAVGGAGGVQEPDLLIEALIERVDSPSPTRQQRHDRRNKAP